MRKYYMQVSCCSSSSSPPPFNYFSSSTSYCFYSSFHGPYSPSHSSSYLSSSVFHAFSLLYDDDNDGYDDDVGDVDDGDYGGDGDYGDACDDDAKLKR